MNLVATGKFSEASFSAGHAMGLLDAARLIEEKRIAASETQDSTFVDPAIARRARRENAS